MEPFGADDRKARVSISKHKYRIGLNLHHQLIALGDDITHCFAQVCTHGLHIHVRICQFEVLKEHPIEIVVIVLPSVSQQTVEIQSAFVNHCRQADNFWPRADNNQKLQLPVVLELCYI